MPLLVHRIEVRANGAEILRTLERAKAAGDFLLHLGHANSALAQIVGEWHPQVRREAQHRVGMLAQAADEIERQGLLNSASAFVLPGSLWVAGISLG
jgi:hypothetical protein